MESLGTLIQRESSDEEFDLLETMNEGARAGSWDQWLREALEILQDKERIDDWPRATAVIYWAISRDPEFPCEKMELVARLYWCLIQSPEVGEHEENLVWSIAKDLKGVDYESDWDPMADPEVRAHMAKMN